MSALMFRAIVACNRLNNVSDVVLSPLVGVLANRSNVHGELVFPVYFKELIEDLLAIGCDCACSSSNGLGTLP